MARYLLVATYSVQKEIETDLTGEDLFNYYAGIVNSEETKRAACLMRAERLCYCKCGSTFARSHPKYCSICGSQLKAYGNDQA